MIKNFGTVLSREQMKFIKGGFVELEGGTCNAVAHCTGCRQVKCSGNSSCNAVDDDGVTCDGVKTKCKKGGEPGCVHD